MPLGPFLAFPGLVGLRFTGRKAEIGYLDIAGRNAQFGVRPQIAN